MSWCVPRVPNLLGWLQAAASVASQSQRHFLQETPDSGLLLCIANVTLLSEPDRIKSNRTPPRPLCPRVGYQSARPTVRPNKDVAQGLGAGELVWNLTVCEKQETMVIAALLT